MKVILLALVLSDPGQVQDVVDPDSRADIAYCPLTDQFVSVAAIEPWPRASKWLIQAAFIDAASGLVVGRRILDDAAVVKGSPSIAWNPAGRTFLVAYVGPASTKDIVVLVLDETGAPVGGSTAAVIGSNRIDAAPRISCNGNDWLVVWSGSWSSGRVIHGRIIRGASTNGAIAFGTDILAIATTAASAPDLIQPDVAFGAGSAFLAVWTSKEGAPSSVWARAVLSDGSMLSPVRLSDGAAAADPVVAASPANQEFLVAWMEGGRPRMRRVDAWGTPVVATQDAVPAGGAPRAFHRSQRLGLAWNGEADQYLLVWVEAADQATFNVRGARLNGSDLRVLESDLELGNPARPGTDPWMLQAASRSTDTSVRVQWAHLTQESRSASLWSTAADLGPGEDRPWTGQLSQRRLDGATPIPAGAVIPETGFVGGALPASPLGRAVHLEAEIREAGQPFTGIPAGTGDSVLFQGLERGRSYRWQARAVDDRGRRSAWTPFGGDPDLIVRPTQAAPLPGAAAQRRASTGADIAVGQTLLDRGVTFDLEAADPDGDPVRLEVEVRPLGTPFSGVATQVGSWSEGGRLSLDVPLPQGKYRWAFLLRDALLDDTGWLPFGGNDEHEADFVLQSFGSAGGGAGCHASRGPGPLPSIVFLLMLAAMRVTVRVKPRASREKVEAGADGLIVWTTAAPTDGKANAAVRRLVAGHFKVAPSRVTLFRGAASREKVFDVE